MENTYIFNAIKNNDLDTVKKYLENKGDVEEKDEQGSTLLSEAIRQGREEIALLLIEYKADLSCMNYATTNEGIKILYLSAVRGLYSIFNILIELQKDTNERVHIKYGLTALMGGSINGHKEIVRTLLERGANVNIADNDGETALHMAAHYGHIDICRMLIQYGANVNAIDNGGDNCLYKAINRTRTKDSDIDIVKFLIENGANINVANKNNFTALSSAASGGDVKVVKYLIDKGAKLKNEGDITISSVINWCSEYPEIVNMLKPFNKGGCFIATATLGSEEHLEVKFLQQYRDTVLLHSLTGRLFVSCYYRISPSIAKFISKNDIYRFISYIFLVKPIIFIIRFFYKKSSN